MRDVSSELFLRLLEILKENNIGFFVVEVNGVCERNVMDFLLLFRTRKSDMDVQRYIQNLAIIVKEEWSHFTKEAVGRGRLSDIWLKCYKC